MKHAAARKRRKKTRLLAKVGVIAGISTGWLWSGTSLALVFSIVQITSFDSCSRNPSLNKDGSRMAFLSEGNPTGNNADGNREIFVWTRSTGGFTQVTNSTGCCNNAPVISAKNDRVVFTSNLDLIVGNNVDGGEELFLWDSKTDLKQLTNDTSGNCCIRDPSITGDAKRIAFESNLDLTGNNADGNEEIFLWDDKAGLSQLTNTTNAGSFDPAISSDALRIAFVSNADFVGKNTDGNFEIFLWDNKAGFSQLTNALLGDSIFPAINAEGKRVAFVSWADLIGENADGNDEVFLWDSKTGLRQLTHSTIEEGTNTDPAISADGNRVAFASDVNLVGSNADRNQEIFLWDSVAGLSQVTNTADNEEERIDNFEPSIDKNGDVIAYTVERADSSSENNSQEIFLSDVARK
jgi:Tol biopolymer transport system component